MTTVAFDGTTMAADSQIGGGAYLENCARKVREINGQLVGAAGVLELTELFFDWCERGMPQDQKPAFGSDFEGLVVSGDKCFWYGSKLFPCATEVPAAIGSGAPYAKTAMFLGQGARDAVKVAIALDEGSGGRIRSIGQ